jgi:hypothetical protein
MENLRTTSKTNNQKSPVTLGVDVGRLVGNVGILTTLDSVEGDDGKSNLDLETERF